MCFIFFIMVMNKISSLAGKYEKTLLVSGEHLGVVCVCVCVCPWACVGDAEGCSIVCPRVVVDEADRAAQTPCGSQSRHGTEG